jgi:hypothetical protein
MLAGKTPMEVTRLRITRGCGHSPSDSAVFTDGVKNIANLQAAKQLFSR